MLYPNDTIPCFIIQTFNLLQFYFGLDIFQSLFLFVSQLRLKIIYTLNASLISEYRKKYINIFILIL